MALARGLTVALVAITCLHLTCAEVPRTRHLSSFLDGVNNDINNKINFVGTLLNQDAQAQQSGYGGQQQQDAQIQGLLGKGQQGRHLSSFLDGVNNDINNKINFVGTLLNQDAQAQQSGYGGQQQQDAQIQGLLGKGQQNRHLLSFLDGIDQDVNNKLNFVGTVLNQQLGQDAKSQQYGYGQQQQQDAQIQGLLNKQQSNNRHLLSFLDGIDQDVNNKLNFVGTVLNQQIGQDAKSQQYGYGGQQQQDAQIQGLLNKQQSNNRHLLSFLDGINQDVNNKINFVGTLLGQDAQAQQSGYGGQQQQDAQIQGLLGKGQKRHLMSFLDGIDQDVNNKLNLVGTLLGQDAKSQQYGYGAQQQQDAQIQGLLNKQQSNNRHLLSFLDGIDQDVNNKLNYVGTVLNLNKGNILGQQQQQDSQIQDKLAYDQQYQNKNRHLLANKRRNLASFLPDLHGQQNAYGTVHQKYGQQIAGEIGSQIANQLGQDQQIQSTLDNQINNNLINPINSQIVAVGSAITAQLNQDQQIQQNLFGGQQAQDAKIQGALGQDQQNQDAKIQSALGNDQQSQDAAIQGAVAQQQNQDAQIQGSLGQTQQGRRLSEIERAQAERARILKSIFGDRA